MPPGDNAELICDLTAIRRGPFEIDIDIYVDDKVLKILTINLRAN
jgi:hypothetical protein